MGHLDHTAVTLGEITRRRFLEAGAAAFGGMLTRFDWADEADPRGILSRRHGNAGTGTTHIDTSELLGIESPEARIAFHPEDGRLVTLCNHLTGDEYLKDPRKVGNPFRVYTDFIRPFELEDDPADIARTALDPFSCRLVSTAFEDWPGGSRLKMVYRDQANHWEVHLTVALSARGSSEWILDVINMTAGPREIMVDFPFFERLCLGQTRRTNLATVLDQAGHIAPAGDHPGGIYGNGGEWSMQWHCVFDPDSGSALGLIIKDPEVRNKRLGDDSPSIRVSTFPAHELQSGERLSLPPAQVIIYQGDWRRTAKEYRAWFAEALRPLEPPEWVRRSDGYTGEWFGKRGGASMPGARQMDSFRDLPEAYRQSPIDHREWAFHDRGCQFPVSPAGVNPPRYVHTTGDNILREDLGGPDALREGVASVHALGFHFTFYVEGYIVHETSELAKDGRAKRWSLMHKNGTITGNYTSQGFYHMCPACEEWQDHLASACSRLLRQTDADGVRLDSLGFYFLPCYNPAHNHPNPFVYNDGVRQLLDKVSRALREVNPNAIITTEAPVDFFAQSTHGALNSMCPREIPPMRVAVPNYHPLVYGALGPVWASLSGCVGGTGGLETNWRCARFPVDETVLWGEVEEDPTASERRVVCRLFRGEDHWALVGARVNSDEPWLFPRGLDGQPTLGLDDNPGPVHVRVRGLAAFVESAMGFDVKTLQPRPVTMTRSQDDLLLSLDWAWFLIILRRSGCRPMVSFGNLPSVAAGQRLPLDVHFVPASERTSKVTATLLAPGLGVRRELRIPESSILEVPEGTPPGWYLVTLDSSAVLGHKRFLKVDIVPKEAISLDGADNRKCKGKDIRAAS